CPRFLGNNASILARVPDLSNTSDSMHERPVRRPDHRVAVARRRRPLTGKPILAYARPMTDIYEALAASARRAILDELHDRNGQTLFEICGRLVMKHDLALSRQAISQHLEVLESAGLVRSERKGRYKFHYLDTG